MPVTECAILKLRANYDGLEFLETLMECQEIQDGWICQHHPHNLEPNVNLSSMYTEATEPSTLLVTAPWESPEAHGEWIQSGDNQIANGKLSRFIAPGCESVLLFHMEPAGERTQMREAFVHKDANDGFDVCCITVAADQREELQRKYQVLEDDLRDKGQGNSIWGGWKIEKSGNEEDLVVFWSDDVPRDQVKELTNQYAKRHLRRFRHVV